MYFSEIAHSLMLNYIAGLSEKHFLTTRFPSEQGKTPEAIADRLLLRCTNSPKRVEYFPAQSFSPIFYYICNWIVRKIQFSDTDT